MTSLLRASLVIAALGLAEPASASRGDSARQVRAAEAALAQGQPRTARIALMNAIKADPANGAAHLLQGRTYIVLGNGVAAEAEIARAREAGVEIGRTRAPMAHALVLQGNAIRALEELRGGPVPRADAATAARVRGRALAMMGDPAGAIAAFDAAIRLAPRDAAIWADLGRFRFEGGDLAGAIVAADNALTLDRGLVDALILKGQLTRLQLGLVSALPWFERALLRDAVNVPALIEKAATLGDLGRAGEMLAATRLALVQDPGNPQAFYLQAVLAARARNFPLARAMMARTRGALDDTPAAMLLYAVIEYQAGNIEQAVDQLQRLLAIQPDNAKARRLLGAAQWRAGDINGTIDALRPIVELPQADSYSLMLIGRAYERAGDRATAATYIDRAMMPARVVALLGQAVSAERIDVLRRGARPGDARSTVPLIRALMRNGRNAEALDVAVELQRANRGAAQAHVLVGDVLDAMGRTGEALALYRYAARLSFTEPVALRLIEAERRLGNARAAYITLDRFLRQNPRSVPALLLAADFLLNARDFARAIPLYEDLRRRLGDRDAMMLNNLAWCYAQTGRSRRAVMLAARAYAMSPGNPAIADTYGWLLVRTRQNLRRGVSLLEQAVAQAPQAADPRWHLAQAYALNRQRAEARVAVQAVLALPGFGERAAAQSLLARL